MKRFAILAVAVTLLLSTCISEAYAVTPESGALPKKVAFYLKPDISVELNGVRQVFKDAKGQNTYPIIYNGTTYLPIRAISALMKEPIEWNSGSKSVYIGKTLLYPVKSSAPIPKEAATEASESDLAVLAGLEPIMVTGYSKPDVIVMFDFEMQTFKDANGVKVYPINYNGSTYLPIRAISDLMDEPIIWDGVNKKVSIGDGEEEEEAVVEEENDEEEPSDDSDDVLDQLKGIYESEEALYYEAAAKISSIKDATADQKQAIAASASDNYLKAQATTLEVKGISKASFTETEVDACDKLLAFAESNEYYILVLENIAYLAASDADYSMLADTFLYFAMEAQTKMEEAKDCIYREPVYN